MYIILISIAIVCLRQPLTTTVPIRFPLTPALSHLHKAGGLHKECSSGTGATMLYLHLHLSALRAWNVHNIVLKDQHI